MMRKNKIKILKRKTFKQPRNVKKKKEKIVMEKPSTMRSTSVLLKYRSSSFFSFYLFGILPFSVCFGTGIQPYSRCL